MLKTILIPTDFSIESLNLFKAAATHEGDQLHIILYHAMVMSDSILDLLFSPRDTSLDRSAHPDFWDAVKIIQNKYGARIRYVRVEVFTGNTLRAFENFIEGNQVDTILVPEDYQFQLLHAKSIDPMRFINSIRTEVKKVSWDRQSSMPEKNKLSEIFYFNPGQS
jgi:hypothetical protein